MASCTTSPPQAAIAPPRAASSFKRTSIRTLASFCRHYLQNSLCHVGKSWCWHKVCVPYLVWRDVELPCTTGYGAHMLTRPCQMVEGRIFFFGVWEPNVTALFESFVRRGDVVVDVGANVGYYTLLSSRLVGPAGRVYAVEPSATTRQRLQRHLALNSVANVTVLPVAAWDRDGAAELHFNECEAGSSSLRDLSCGTTSEQVELRCLDDLVRESDVPRISLIKLDIEGAELHALRGLSRLLDANRRLAIIAEVNPEMLEGLGSSADALSAFLREKGFIARRIPNSYDVSAYIAPHSVAPPEALNGSIVSPSYICFTRS